MVEEGMWQGPEGPAAAHQNLGPPKAESPGRRFTADSFRLLRTRLAKAQPPAIILVAAPPLAPPPELAIAPPAEPSALPSQAEPAPAIADPC